MKNRHIGGFVCDLGLWRGFYLASGDGFHYNTAAEITIYLYPGGYIRHEQC